MQKFYTPFTRSSNYQANVEQLEHTSCTCILNAFARCLLDRVNGVLLWPFTTMNLCLVAHVSAQKFIEITNHNLLSARH